MNTYDASGSQVCRVDQIRIKYREVGTSSWSKKNMAQPTGYDAVTGVCNSTNNTSKAIRNLSPSTTYEWQVKVWYCVGGNTGWSTGPDFTTLGSCPNVGNLSVSTPTTTKATFTWTLPADPYSFARIKLRVDTIEGRVKTLELRGDRPSYIPPTVLPQYVGSGVRTSIENMLALTEEAYGLSLIHI